MKRKIISMLVVLLLCLSMTVPASAEIGAHVFDNAGLLTEVDGQALADKLADISEKHEAEIVITTLASLNGSDIEQFLHYTYDAMEMGYGKNHDGVYLLVCMDIGQWRILANGYAGEVINSEAITAIGEIIVPELSAANYTEAFNAFADQCDHYLGGYRGSSPFDVGKGLIIALAIGIVAGLIAVFVLKGQLKTVYKQNQANNSVKQGSMKVTVANDLYLYREVSRTKKESSNKSSSSGSSRSTGGGSF